VLLDKQMNLLSQNGSMPLDVAAVRPTRNLDQRQDLTVPGGVAYWRPVYLHESVGADRQLEGYVLSALSTTGADRELNRLREGLIVGGSVGALAAALLSQWMVGTSLRPIREQINRLVRFTSDASHELRHPLTAIRAVIGATREGGYLSGVDPELSRKFSLIDNATAEMSSLVEDLLLLTRLDRELPEEHHWRRFDLCELAEDLAALYQDRATTQQVRVTLNLVAPTWINGNADQLRRLISNLLVNALQFTPARGTVALGVVQKGHHAIVTVEDQGPGIPIEQRELIFERFWQANAARTGPNSGLGLSIARSIALVHGGSIEAQTADQGGCRMVVQLPAAG
jgi:two-component system OmpR family sensor kinase